MDTAILPHEELTVDQFDALTRHLDAIVEDYTQCTGTPGDEGIYLSTYRGSLTATVSNEPLELFVSLTEQSFTSHKDHRLCTHAQGFLYYLPTTSTLLVLEMGYWRRLVKVQHLDGSVREREFKQPAGLARATAPLSRNLPVGWYSRFIEVIR